MNTKLIALGLAGAGLALGLPISGAGAAPADCGAITGGKPRFQKMISKITLTNEHPIAKSYYQSYSVELLPKGVLDAQVELAEPSCDEATYRVEVNATDDDETTKGVVGQLITTGSRPGDGSTTLKIPVVVDGYAGNTVAVRIVVLDRRGAVVRQTGYLEANAPATGLPGTPGNIGWQLV